MKRIRPLNIGIILATQLFFFYLVIKPFLLTNQAFFTLQKDIHFWIIIIVTCIVCIGGYIINDIFDIEIDQVNKPIDAMQSPGNWVLIYKVLFLVGFILTSLLSYIYSNIYFLAIYVLSWVVLFQYSARLKCTELIGNVIVAFFSGLVVCALLGPFFGTFGEQDLIDWHPIVRPFSYYFIFAFLISLMREIIKDIEDVKGDKLMGCQTIAVVSGVERAKIVVIFFGVVFMVLFGMWQWFYLAELTGLILLLINLFISVPFGFVLLKVNSAFLLEEESEKFRAFAQKKDLRNPWSVTQISFYLKLIMIMGIVSLVFMTTIAFV